MEIQHFETLPRDILEGVQIVHQAVFEGDVLKEEKLANKEGFLALICFIDGQVAGFKFGYEVEEGVFYSWLGGVHPNFQQRGIAKALMLAQHELLQVHSYQKIRTFSRNNRKAMLILNLKCGFDVVDTFIDKKGHHKIILEKML